MLQSHRAWHHQTTEEVLGHGQNTVVQREGRKEVKNLSTKQTVLLDEGKWRYGDADA